ncbi:riboflavin synthase [Acetobacterium paludosum]|uniref:Riboflavin synthase n=1 Tax=Acetobacterium paludosum TaxID=52693 RepID=A0A923I3N9_9FIRM|nr:riboflavin synthase [Acetobacterium paludosum]MBC3888495.1 riboflavin synthase [Acetobacterium paludosum]
MFTGIIEEVGGIIAVTKGPRSSQLWIQGNVIMDDLKLGDSVAVNGVCLTVSRLKSNQWMADVMSETLKRSDLGELKSGSPINLERAMPANGRFGGHLVSGHIDGTGQIIQIKKDDNAILFEISASEKIRHYIIEKGSIAIDGISLTVTTVNNEAFQVAIIPHTVKHTILGLKKKGDLVNLENDLVGKYIENFLRSGSLENTNANDEKKSSKLTMDFLTRSGF